ncbi:kinase-like protein, partial [Canariomyces notabilis]
MEAPVKLEEYDPDENKTRYESGGEIAQTLATIDKVRHPVKPLKKVAEKLHVTSRRNKRDVDVYPFARKTIKLPAAAELELLDAAKQAFLKEVQILRHAQQCHHVVKLIEAYAVGGNNPCLVAVMERAEHDLETFLSAATLEQHHLDRIRQWFTCLASVVDDIHDRGIRHRDIKPANILIKNGEVLLSDFGISQMGIVKTLSTTMPEFARARSVPYCAPEVEDGSSRGRSADIFSLGAVFLEMLVAHSYSGRRAELRKDLRVPGLGDGAYSYAFRLDNVHGWIRKLETNATGATDQTGGNLPEWRLSIIHLCHEMLQEDRDKRPQASQIVHRLRNMPSTGLACRCTSADWAVSMTGDSDARPKLIEACKRGSLSDVRRLSDRVDLAEIGAIHLAAARNHLDIVEFLLESRVDVNLCDYSSQTALHCAAGNGCREIVQTLLTRYKAEVNLADVEGRRALHYAAGGGYGEIVDML